MNREQMELAQTAHEALADLSGLLHDDHDEGRRGIFDEDPVHSLVKMAFGAIGLAMTAADAIAANSETVSP